MSQLGFVNSGNRLQKQKKWGCLSLGERQQRDMPKGIRLWQRERERERERDSFVPRVFYPFSKVRDLGEAPGEELNEILISFPSVCSFRVEISVDWLVAE